MEMLPWFAVEQAMVEMDRHLACLTIFGLQRLRTFHLDGTMTMNDN
jgi:hypothetical protein